MSPLDKLPGVKFLDHMAVIFLIFWGFSVLYCRVAAPNLHSHQQSWGFPFLHILTNTCYLLSFFIIAIMTGVRWYLIVVLIFISLMISDVSVFSRAFWPLYIFFGKMSVQVLCPFKNHVLGFFWMLSSVSSLCILDIRLLSYISFANIFSHFVGGLFVLLIVSFVV